MERKIKCSFQIIIFLIILFFADKSLQSLNLTGSNEFGITYIDIDKPLNNTAYNRGPAYNYRFMMTGKISDYDFSGIGNLLYTQKKDYKKFEFETLRLEFIKPTHSMIFGQVYPQFSELTLNNQKIEGANLKIFRNKWNIEFFGGLSNQYEKLSTLNQTAEYTQYLNGLKTDYIANSDLKISATVFYAEDDKSSIDTGTPILGPIKNRVYAITTAINSTDKKGNLIIDLARSEYDKDKKDASVLLKKDKSILTVFKYDFLENLRTSLQYKRIGKDYYTAGNPSLNSSETGYKGFFGQYEYALTNTLFSGYAEVYSEDSFDTSGIKTDYWIWDNNIKQTIDDNNEVALGTYFKSSEKEDNSIDSLKGTVKLIYTKKINKARLSTNINYSKTDDKTLSNSDSKVKGISTTYSNRFLNNNLFLSAFVLANKTEMTTGDLKFFMANLNLNHKLMPNKLLATANFGFQLNSAATELTRTYTNNINFKYYFSYEKTMDLELKNDRKFGGETTYNVWCSNIRYTFIF